MVILMSLLGVQSTFFNTFINQSTTYMNNSARNVFKSHPVSVSPCPVNTTVNRVEKLLLAKPFLVRYVWTKTIRKWEGWVESKLEVDQSKIPYRSSENDSWLQGVEHWQKVQNATDDHLENLEAAASAADQSKVVDQTGLVRKERWEKEDVRKDRDKYEGPMTIAQEREMLREENTAIKNQSDQISKIEADVAKNPDYQALKPNIEASRAKRDAAIAKRAQDEEIWQEELNHEEEQEKENNNRQNTECIAEQSESSKGKRRLEVDSEQAESSKRRQLEPLSTQEQGESSKKGTPGEYLDSLPKEHNPFDDVGDD
jgi:hypothetical protein